MLFDKHVLIVGLLRRMLNPFDYTDKAVLQQYINKPLAHTTVHSLLYMHKRPEPVKPDASIS